MHRVLRLRPHLLPMILEGDRTLLVGEQERVLLTGPLISAVLPLVDGEHTRFEVVSALRERLGPQDVLYTLSWLEERGYITESRRNCPPEEDAFWHGLGLGDVARERLQSMPVGVDAVGEAAPLCSAAGAALGAASIRIDQTAIVRLLLTDDYLHSGVEAYARQAAQQGRHWIIVKPSGRVPWIGPVFRSGGDGACWHCLAHRLARNRPVEQYVKRSQALPDAPRPPAASLASTVQAALNLAASTLAHWIASGFATATERTLWAVTMVPPGLTPHAVVRRPQCPVCGDPGLIERRLRAPVTIESRRKTFTEDGGHRCISPEETLARHRHLVSPITGVVAHLGPVPDRMHALRPVFGATVMSCPEAGSGPGVGFVRYSLGKGRTHAQAEAGALCEAIERAALCFQGDEPLLYARMDDLNGEAIDPRELQGFSEGQYQRRTELNRRAGDRRRVIPVPFDPARRIAWVPAWSLTRRRRRYLPAAFCYEGAPCDGEGEPCCVLDGNGHASGNCLEEAILQGMLELAERDAVGIWWYNALRRPAIDLASFEEVYFESLSAHYASLRNRLWVLDLTNDLQIPSFAALARSEETGRFSIGFGAHFDPVLGIQRALTEVNQTFDPTCRLPPPWGTTPLPDESFLLPDDTQPRRTCDAFTYEPRSDLADDIAAFTHAAERLGLETLVQDQTRPDMGLHVAKVVVPGLCHIWQRLGPGRLYQVPVTMGWAKAPRGEAELNPVPLHL